LHHLPDKDALDLIVKISEAQPKLLVLDMLFGFRVKDTLTYNFEGKDMDIRGNTFWEWPENTPEDRMYTSGMRGLEPTSFRFQREEFKDFLVRNGFATLLSHVYIYELMPIRFGKRERPQNNRLLFCLPHGND
jgi:hypothetical protein